MNSDQLEKLLKGKPISDYSEIYIWGTGNTAGLYQEGLKRLEREGLLISGYVDNAPSKWGREAFNKPVFSPEEMKQKKDTLILLASPQISVIHAVGSWLDDAGMNWCHIDDFIFRNHISDCLKVTDLFEDDYSKQLYSELIRCRIQGDYPKTDFVEKNQYFALPGFASENSNTVIIDAGAYVGDTLERYIWETNGVFKKYIAFEPDLGNFQALNCRLTRLRQEWNLSENKIEVYPYAVGDKTSESCFVRYEANGGYGSRVVVQDNREIQENVSSIKTIAIDDFIKDCFDFLKADIESYEYKMLNGAKTSIQKYKPKIAVCIYHNAVDFYQIPLLLHEFVPEYKMAIRHHVNVLSETVLYVWK